MSMSFQRVAFAGTLFFTCALSAVTAHAADPDRGEDLAWQHRCMTCHGAEGVTSDARYPHIAGQPSMYLEARLKYFRDEEEPLNQMNGQARPLSDEDIADLAAYFAEQRR
ncbi:MAG: cytochrome c [Pseudomonadales bacterium]|jgi:cytochrome c553|nr:cytochrome c [Pseudomonadales bacterium]